MFAPGDELRLERIGDAWRWSLLRRDEDVGEIAFIPGARTARFTVGDRRWSISSFGRGWTLGIYDASNTIVAGYAERWVMPGRLAFPGHRPLAFRLPLAWRRWTVADGRRKLVELDRTKDDVVGRVLGEPPAGIDGELLVGLTCAIVVLRLHFPEAAPMASTHAIESRAEWLDEIFE